MKGITRETFAAGVLAFASRASAQVASACQGDVCFKLNIPESTASSGTGDIFFQISAPSSYEWAALGQGSSMGNSNMFVIYTSGDGNNVTLSPRQTSGHDPPSFNSDAEVTLLEGTGVSNGKMIANVRCSNCNSWSGGEVDFSGDNGQFIFAAQSSGGPKNSDDTGARIAQHNARDTFEWSFASAKGGSQVNPLLNAQPSGTASGTAPTSCVPRAAVSGSASPSASSARGSGQGNATPTSTADDDDNYTRPWGRPTKWESEWGPSPTASGRPWGPPDNEKRQDVVYCDDDGGSSITPIGGGGFMDMNATRKMLIAHGVLASLAFVIFFPAGSIAIRLASFRGIVWFHAAFQAFAYIVYVAAFGLGVYLANEFNNLDTYHPIIGIVVFVLLFFQPILGFLHHMLFKKHQTRTLWSYAHLWIGRIAITLGIINGGLGMKLADTMGMSSRSGMIAYGVVAGVVWLTWVAASVIGERRRKTSRPEQPPKYSEGSLSQTETRQRSDASPPEHGHYAPK